MAKQKEAPRADLIEKDPTESHEALAEFIAEQTGYDPDVKTVQMVRVLYRPFIRSEEHQGRLETAREAREEAEAAKEERRAEREKKTAAAAKAPAKAPAKKAAAKAPAKKAPAKKAAARKATANAPF